MIGSSRHPSLFWDPRNQVDSALMSRSEAQPSTAYSGGLQTHEDNLPIAVDVERHYRFLGGNSHSLLPANARRWLEEIRLEAEKAYAMDSALMSRSEAQPSTAYSGGLQTHKSDLPMRDDLGRFGLFPGVDLHFLLSDNVLRHLKEIRSEAEKAYASDSEIDPIQDSAYDDAYLLLQKLLQRNIPMPEIGWAADGSLGFEWRPGNGIATMGIYGDSLVIYGAFFEDKRQVEGVCALSDGVMLSGFLETLLALLF